MRVSFEVTLCGQTFHLGTHPEDDEPVDASPDVVMGAHSSVEFGFAPEPEAYWGEDRQPRRRR